MEGRARGRSERRFVLLTGVVAFRHPEFIASMVVEWLRILGGIGEVIKKGQTEVLWEKFVCHFFPPTTHLPLTSGQNQGLRYETFIFPYARTEGMFSCVVPDRPVYPQLFWLMQWQHVPVLSMRSLAQDLWICGPSLLKSTIRRRKIVRNRVCCFSKGHPVMLSIILKWNKM